MMRLIDFYDPESNKCNKITWAFCIKDHKTRRIIKRATIKLDIVGEELQYVVTPILDDGIEDYETFAEHIPVILKMENGVVKLFVDGLDIESYDLKCKREMRHSD